MSPSSEINTPSQSSGKIGVMLVDDSAVVRGLISRILSTETDIEIVGTCSNGEQAIRSIARYKPDIVLLDIEMPLMDGITALPRLLETYPEAKIVMCSTLTERNAKITMEAFRLGATECIAKPKTSDEVNKGVSFQEQLIKVIRTLGKAASAKKPAAPSKTGPGENPAAQSAQKPQFTKALKSFELKKPAPGILYKTDVLAIGSSTGGPQALFKVISHLKTVKVPIIITQHMPATFTRILAQHITQHTGVTAHEGENGMVLEAGKAYVAPGEKHMTFKRTNEHVEIVLNDGPPENFCKPSVDPMLRSAIDIWGKNILCVILTGMGNDGLKGGQILAEKNGRVIAQDEQSSVVWGMPGAVAMAGICSNVLPLDEIGPWISKELA